MDDFPIKHTPEPVRRRWDDENQERLSQMRAGQRARFWTKDGMKLPRWAEELGVEISVTCQGFTEKGSGIYDVVCVGRTEDPGYWRSNPTRIALDIAL